MKLTQLHVKPSDVRLTGQASPLHFSWKVTESTGIKQVWARICIHRGEKTLFDSGVDALANSEDYSVNFLPELCGTYQWTVEAMSDSGEYAAAASSFSAENWTQQP